MKSSPTVGRLVVNTAKKLNMEVHFQHDGVSTYGGGWKENTDWVCTISINGNDFFVSAINKTKVGAYLQAIASFNLKISVHAEKMFDEMIKAKGEK